MPLVARVARLLLKIAFGLIAAILLLLISALAAYDVTHFQPHRSEIDRLLSGAADDERELPAAVAGLLKVSMGGHTCQIAARQLLFGLDLAPRRGGMLAWHAKSAAWSMLTCVHLNERERLTAIATLAYAGAPRTHGLSASANVLFGRPLSQLSLEQQAELIALSDNPYLIDSPERRAKRTAALLARYRANT